MANNIWSNLARSGKVAPCESLLTQIPVLPRRSWAYHLAPMNVGTPSCESLTSYFLRLSQAHCVTPQTLFVRGMCDLNRPIHACGLVSPNSKAATLQINGNGLVAEKWVAKLESITRRNDLRLLTFLPFQGAVSRRKTCRRQRAWCPSCLEDQRRENGPIYEHLLWTHVYVTVCPIHRLLLQTQCPHCGGTSNVLQGSMCTGACAKCSGWLGELADISRSSGHESDETMSDEIFMADQIGRLVVAARSAQFDFSVQTTKRAIRKCIDLCFDGNVSCFVRCVGLGKSAAAHFGRKHLVSLQLMLKIAYAARVNVLDLLNDEDALSGFSANISVKATKGLLSCRRNSQDVFALLKAAATEIPPPSISEVARRLGYSSSDSLPRQFSDICNLITANFRNSARGRAARSFSRTRLQTDEAIVAALKAALKQRPHPSLTQVAKSLGYRASLSIKVRFPELCRGLVDKRQAPLLTRRKGVEDELEQSLRSEHPEAVLAIARRLGYQTNAPLRTAYPELCRQIRIRNQKHKESQFLSRVETSLDTMLAQNPPPSLKAALLRLDVSDGWLRKHFPVAHRSLSSRYVEFRAEESHVKKLKDKNRIRAIVRELDQKGTFPSMNAVLDVFTASALKRTEVWATIKQAREELLL
jgi:AraC-like DNA-binding protein